MNNQIPDPTTAAKDAEINRLEIINTNTLNGWAASLGQTLFLLKQRRTRSDTLLAELSKTEAEHE